MARKVQRFIATSDVVVVAVFCDEIFGDVYPYAILMSATASRDMIVKICMTVGVIEMPLIVRGDV